MVFVGCSTALVFFRTHLISFSICVVNLGCGYTVLRTSSFLTCFSFHLRISYVLDAEEVGQAGRKASPTASTSGSESFMTTDNESEEEMDPWIPLREEAKQSSNIAFEEMKESLINSSLEEQSAKEKIEAAKWFISLKTKPNAMCSFRDCACERLV